MSLLRGHLVRALSIPVSGGTIEEGVCFSLLCYAFLCYALCTLGRFSAVFSLKCVRFVLFRCIYAAGCCISVYVAGRFMPVHGTGCILFFFLLQEVVAGVYQGRVAALGDEEELPLDVGRGQYVVLVEECGVEESVLHGKADDALHVGRLLLVKAVCQVVVEEAVCRHVIALAGVDAAKGL